MYFNEDGEKKYKHGALREYDESVDGDFDDALKEASDALDEWWLENNYANFTTPKKRNKKEPNASPALSNAHVAQASPGTQSSSPEDDA